MKKLILSTLFVIAVLSYGTVCAQNNRETSNRAKTALPKNVISLSETYRTIGSYNIAFINLPRIEYAHKIKNNFYLGGRLTMLIDAGRVGNRPAPGKLMHLSICLTDIIAHYYLPVVKNRLYLRGSIGIGAGYHKISEHSGFCTPDQRSKTTVYITAELLWIWKISRSVELQFAPLLISPSQFSYSLSSLGGEITQNQYMFNIAHFGIGFWF